MVPSGKLFHPLYQSQSLTRRSPRPKLVFLLWTGVCKMAQFGIVKALDLTLVLGRFVQAMLLFLLLVRLCLSRIDIWSRNRAFSVFSVSLALFFLLVVPGFIKRLLNLGGSRHESFSLKLVFAIIFHHSLILDVVCDSMCRLIFSGDLLIGLSYVGSWSQVRFSLGSYCFCYQLFIIVQVGSI